MQREQWLAALQDRFPQEAVDAIADRLARAAAQWPDLDVPPAVFVAHLARHLPPDEPVADALDRMHTGDLYLACACAAGNARAIQQCLAQHGRMIATEAARTRHIAGDELEQELRVALFVARGEQPPLIADYAGRGPLSRWLRAVVVHSALKAREQRRGPAALPNAEPLSESRDFAESAGDPELLALELAHRSAFSRAFALAMKSLTAEERTMLRQRFLDGLGIDALAPLYGMHRATIARRLVRLRAQLLHRVRRTLAEAEGLATSEITSVLRAVRGRLDLSISRHFAESGD